MRFSRERKIFVVVCGLALVALVVDRTLLVEAGDDGSDISGDGASLLIARSPGERAGARSASSPAGSSAPTAASISTMLRQMAEENRAQLARTPDAFQPAGSWDRTPVQTAAPEPLLVAPDIQVEQFVRRKLASLTAGGRRGAGAMVDGRMVHIGESLDGFRLVSVDSQSALFEGRSVQVRLTLNGEARVGRLSPTSAPPAPAPAPAREAHSPTSEWLSGG